MYKRRQRNDLSIEQVDDDLVILDKRNQKVHQLNSTASAIWSSIEEGRDTELIVQDFIANFDLSPEVASQDVARILKEFCALGLLEDPVEHSDY